MKVVKEEKEQFKAHLFSYTCNLEGSLNPVKSQILVTKGLIKLPDSIVGFSVDFDNCLDISYESSLSTSRFVICSLGSELKSTLLWDCINSGVIPVVVNNDCILPGNPALWKSAVIDYLNTESDIARLPGRLAKISLSPSELEDYYYAKAQLRFLYGKECFIYNILHFFIANASVVPSELMFVVSISSCLDRGFDQDTCITAFRSLVSYILLYPKQSEVSFEYSNLIKQIKSHISHCPKMQQENLSLISRLPRYTWLNKALYENLMYFNG
jgi:hypothetical protein